MKELRVEDGVFCVFRVGGIEIEVGRYVSDSVVYDDVL